MAYCKSRSSKHSVWGREWRRRLAEARMKTPGGMHAHPSCDIGCQTMTALLQITQLACAYQQATNFGAFSAKSCGPAAGCCLFVPMDERSKARVLLQLALRSGEICVCYALGVGM